jgi:hypothetical protein
MQFVITRQDDLPHGKDDPRHVAIALDHPLGDVPPCDTLAIAVMFNGACGHKRPAGLQMGRLPGAMLDRKGLFDGLLLGGLAARRVAGSIWIGFARGPVLVGRLSVHRRSL